MRSLAPLTLVLGTFAALVVASHAKATPSPVVEPPQGPLVPATTPLLPTLPGTQGAPANIDILRQQLGALLAQTKANPGSVDANALDALAVQLRQAGLTPEALAVETAASQLIRAAPGGNAK